VLDEHDAKLDRFAVIFPKDVALPVVAIVTYSIILVVDAFVSPPPKIPLVGEEHPAPAPKAVTKLPKLLALPVVAIVT
jgi:hypothetical protein